jgi:GT2 family glycosyltransferase
MNQTTRYLNDLIGIVILNYNGSAKNIGCLHSIFNQSHTNLIVVFVDNNSTDNSVSLVQQFCDENAVESVLLDDTQIQEVKPYKQKLIIIKNSQNKGYSFGNNVGLKFAKTNISNLSNLLILNNDVILPTNYLESLLKRYHSLESTYGTKKIALGSPEYSLNGKITHPGFHYLNLSSGLVFKYPIPPYYSYLVGASIFLDNNPPLFDEVYFLYFDDAEYTKILQNQDYKIASLKDSYYIHDQGFSTRKCNDLSSIVYTSMKIFYTKHYPVLKPLVFAIRFSINLLKGNVRKNKLLIDHFLKKPTIKL